MDNSRNRPGDHLGINRVSKNIRKSPLHQPTFTNPKQQQQQQQQSSNNGGGSQQQPQPQVYNINKSDFRSIVQQLTGTPTRDPSPSSHPPPPAGRPPLHNPPRPPSTRLQRIRPPPLAPIARPPAPPPHSHPLNPNPNFYPRPMPPPPAAAPALSPAIPFSPLLPPTPPPGSSFCANTLESPISAYMRYLESSIMDTDGSRRWPPLALQQGVAGHPASSTHMLPNSHFAGPFPSPGATGPPIPPSPGLLPSPTSQFALPSPSEFLNLLSPRSPFPLLSPRLPMTPNFVFSPMGGQPGILGPGPQLPPSPGPVFPPSPSGFLPIMSPRWRDL